MSAIYDADLMRECCERVGYIKGPRLAHFVLQWRMAEVAYDRPITVDDSADWWTSKRTAFRRLAQFREAFPEYETPGEFPIAAATERRLATR